MPLEFPELWLLLGRFLHRKAEKEESSHYPVVSINMVTASTKVWEKA